MCLFLIDRLCGWKQGLESLVYVAVRNLSLDSFFSDFQSLFEVFNFKSILKSMIKSSGALLGSLQLPGKSSSPVYCSIAPFFLCSSVHKAGSHRRMILLYALCSLLSALCPSPTNQRCPPRKPAAECGEADEVAFLYFASFHSFG